MARCIAFDMDCADLCRLAATLMSIGLLMLVWPQLSRLWSRQPGSS